PAHGGSRRTAMGNHRGFVLELTEVTMRKALPSLKALRRMPARAAIALIAATPLMLSAAAPSNAGALYGLISTGEIYRSTDDGVTWTARATLAVPDAVALAAR